VKGQEPTLEVERAMVARGELLVCLDEVGRGSLAGPVSVGMLVIDPWSENAPAGIRDSKELSVAERVRLEPLVRAWAVAAAVGHASPAEIDEHGIVAALRLAGRRAWATCSTQWDAPGRRGVPGQRPTRALLDGNLDWLTPPTADLFGAAFGETQPGDDEGLPVVGLAVSTRVKGDRDCLGVGAASIIAKVERDALMESLHERFPAYGWEKNKGYGSVAHRAAIVAEGATEVHRRSWKLT